MQKGGILICIPINQKFKNNDKAQEPVIEDVLSKNEQKQERQKQIQLTTSVQDHILIEEKTIELSLDINEAVENVELIDNEQQITIPQ